MVDQIAETMLIKLFINKSRELYLIELRSSKGSSMCDISQRAGMCDRDKGAGRKCAQHQISSSLQNR